MYNVRVLNDNLLHLIHTHAYLCINICDINKLVICSLLGSLLNPALNLLCINFLILYSFYFWALLANIKHHNNNNSSWKPTTQRKWNHSELNKKSRVFKPKIELNQPTMEQPDVGRRETGVCGARSEGNGCRVLCKGQQTMPAWGWGGVHGTTSNGEYVVFFPLIALDWIKNRRWSPLDVSVNVKAGIGVSVDAPPQSPLIEPKATTNVYDVTDDLFLVASSTAISVPYHNVTRTLITEEVRQSSAAERREAGVAGGISRGCTVEEGTPNTENMNTYFGSVASTTEQPQQQHGSHRSESQLHYPLQQRKSQTPIP